MLVTHAKQSLPQEVADSYARWWSDTGLHSTVSEVPHGWLSADPAPGATVETDKPEPRLAEPAGAAPVRTAAIARPMPDELHDFLGWLAEDSSQPETGWNGLLHRPSAQTDLPLLILCDMPGDGAVEPASPFDAMTARFVSAMAGAIGLTSDQIGFAPLAMRRPAGGLLDESTVTALAKRMTHYLALARPRAVLILGDRTSRALIAAQSPATSDYLREIHHKDGKVITVALPSAEHLMRRPAAKAASWQALRLLHGVLTA
jgi:uracil-DNA glycosylase